MTNRIVKYHNDVNTVSLRNFSAAEIDIFMAIFSSMRDKGGDRVVFTFDEIKKLIHWKAKNNDRFLSLLKSSYDKLLHCTIKTGNDEEWTSFVVFTEYTVSKPKSEVAIAVNSKFYYVLNALISNFTRFELEEFISFKSTYAKEFYRRMKQFKSTGIWIASFDEFKRIMDIPEKYDIDKINKKVLNPIIAELGDKYQLEIVKLYEKSGRGRPAVSGFKFTFSKDINHGNAAEAIDVEAKALPAKSEKQKALKAPDPSTPKKPQKPDMELNERVYLMRTLRVRDKKFKDQINMLKIINIIYDPESGLDVEVKNMDDEYINTMHFNSVRLWDKYFNAYVVN